jgi:uncharacterized membrane protein
VPQAPRPRDAAPYTAALALAFSFGPSLLRRQQRDQLVVSIGALALGAAAGAGTEQLVVRLTRHFDGDESLARLALAALGLGATLTELPESRTPALALAGNGARVAGIAALVGWVAPHEIPRGRKRALFAIAAAALGVAGYSTWRKQQQRAKRPQLRYPDPQWLDSVSGGDGSAVPRAELDFEGERFLASAAPARDISELRGGAPAKDPIRVFVGMRHAETVEERCALAVDELERLGAFRRARILVISATLRGYVNPIPVEAEEVFSHGDTAAVVVQYHDKRTPLLWRKVPIAAHTHRELLERLAARDDAPEVCVYGESLGAWSSQRVFGEDGIGGLERLRVVRALWIGTPYFSRFPRRIGKLGDARVGFLNARDAATTDPGIGATWRWVFLQRMTDPVVVFPGIDLIWREPDWMKRQRDMHWRPGITFVQQLVDVVRATAWTSDEPAPVGHDYRTVAPHAVNIALGHGLDSERAEAIGLAVLEREATRSRHVRAARKAAAKAGIEVPPETAPAPAP